MKTDVTATLRGYCPSDESKKCIGMKTGDFAIYVLKAYPKFNSTYKCSQ